MADRTVTARLRADVSGYLAGVRQAQAATAQFTNQAITHGGKHKQAYREIGVTVAGIGVAAGAMAAIAVKKFADFDKAMSGVKAVTGASAAEMNKLREAAIRAGADTAFSASEAATAQGELAKAGISTADILGGALAGSLDLAAAGQLQLGNAAEISAQAMNIFKLRGSDVGHIADVLAAGANKSAADVGQLGDALRQGGLVAAQTGLSLEDTVGTLSAFADRALIGSDAGTSLKTMLQRLNPQSDEAADLMQRLGITAYDAQGNFIGLEAFAGRLQKGLSGLSTEQRNAALATIFGSDAVRAANVLYELGERGVREYTQAVDDEGAAARMAATQLDNLRGDLEELSGSIETALIQTGSAGNTVLRDMVQAATAAVNVYNDLPKPVQTATLAVLGVAGAAGTVGGALLILLPKIHATKVALDEMGISASRAAGALGTLAKIGGTITAIYAVGEGVGFLKKNLYGLDEDVADLSGSFARWADTGKLAGSAAKLVGEDFKNVGLATDYLDRFGSGIGKFLNDFNPFTDALGEGKKTFEDLDATMAALLSSGNAEAARELFVRTEQAVRAKGKSVQWLNGQLPQYTGALAGANAAQKEAAGSAGAMSEAEKKVVEQADKAAKELSDLKDKIDAVVDAQLGGEASMDRFQEQLHGLREQVKGARDEHDKHARSLKGNSEAALENRDRMRGLIQTAADAIKWDIEHGATKDKVTQKTKFFKDELSRTARQLGLNKDDTARYIRVLDDVPNQIQTDVKANTAKAKEDLRKYRDYANITLDQIRDEVVVSTIKFSSNAQRLAYDLRHQGLAAGGPVRGAGGPTQDNIPIWASAGEYVVNAQSTSRHRPLLEAINTGRYAAGGPVVSMRAAESGLGAVGAGADAVERATRSFSERAISAYVKRLNQAITPAIGSAFAPGAPANVSGNAALVRSMAASMYGWSGGQWDALYRLVMKESGFRNTAQNPTSTAYGMFQFLNSTWASVGGHKTSDPRAQTVYGLRYIAQRYGTPSAALSFHLGHNWYEHGTDYVPETGPAMLHRGERIIPAWQNTQMMQVRGGGQGGGAVVHIHFPNFYGDRAAAGAVVNDLLAAAQARGVRLVTANG